MLLFRTYRRVCLYLWGICCSVLQCVEVCCSVLQCFAMCCSVLQCGCSAVQWVAVWCSISSALCVRSDLVFGLVVQRVAVCSSV